MLAVNNKPKTKPKNKLENKLENKSTLMASGGFSWTVVPVERRDEYMQSLEAASVKEDILEFFARGKYWFLALALLLILAGFFFAYKNDRRPPRPTLVFLVLAVLFIIGALTLPLFEGDLLRWLKQ